MRTQEQVNRVSQTLGLSRTKQSFLTWKRFSINTQRQLTELAFELKPLSDDIVQKFNEAALKGINPFDTARSLHF